LSKAASRPWTSGPSRAIERSEGCGGEDLLATEPDPPPAVAFGRSKQHGDDPDRHGCRPQQQPAATLRDLNPSAGPRDAQALVAQIIESMPDLVRQAPADIVAVGIEIAGSEPTLLIGQQDTLQKAAT
jgi:hypothetical protein